MRMVVLGTGYLGATHAACMADLGHEVLGVDVDPAKLAKLEANLAKATPLPRSGHAIDIANAALFLASDEGSFVNSHDLVVDGGRIWQFHEGAGP